MKYAFIARHRQVWPIRWQCAALSVSASGFYEWLARAESNRAKANRELLVAIRTSFSNSDQAYGSPRVWRDVRAWGHQVGEQRVARLMRKSKLVARPKRRRWPKDAGPRPEHALAPNTLERRFDAAAPNVRWIADFTYLWTRAHRDYPVRFVFETQLTNETLIEFSHESVIT